jgi:hypothetical protein
MKSIRIKRLIISGKSYTDSKEIKTLLLKYNFNWLNLSEIENAIIEIKNNKILWHIGVWYYGDWIDGVWLDGIFKHGDFKSGTWYNGTFEGGKFSGIFMNGIFEKGEFNGDFRNGIDKTNTITDLSIKENVKVIKFNEFNT